MQKPPDPIYCVLFPKNNVWCAIKALCFRLGNTVYKGLYRSDLQKIKIKKQIRWQKNVFVFQNDRLMHNLSFHNRK